MEFGVLSLQTTEGCFAIEPWTSSCVSWLSYKMHPDRTRPLSKPKRLWIMCSRSSFHFLITTGIWYFFHGEVEITIIVVLIITVCINNQVVHSTLYLINIFKCWFMSISTSRESLGMVLQLKLKLGDIVVSTSTGFYLHKYCLDCWVNWWQGQQQLTTF